MTDFVLHGFGESGNAYKVALMLAVSKQDWALKSVDFFNGATREASYRDEINEMGEAPVLEHGDKRLTQSGVILTYLAEKTGQFGGKNSEEDREILRWLFFDNHKFTSYLATLRFLLHFVKTGETEVTQFFQGRAKGALAVVDKRLAARDFIAIGEPSIADLSMMGYLFYGDELNQAGGIDLAEYRNIMTWRDRISALDGWQGPYDLMERDALTTMSKTR